MICQKSRMYCGSMVNISEPRPNRLKKSEVACFIVNLKYSKSTQLARIAIEFEIIKTVFSSSWYKFFLAKPKGTMCSKMKGVFIRNKAEMSNRSPKNRIEIKSTNEISGKYL